MHWYFVIKFLHIIAAMMFIGGIFGRQLVRAVEGLKLVVQTFEKDVTQLSCCTG